jgi:hypothetical protein
MKKYCAAGALAASVLAGAFGADAKVYTVIYSGYAGNFTPENVIPLRDNLDWFGLGELQGAPFVVSYTFDNSMGFEQDAPPIIRLDGGVYEGASDPLISASVRINGVLHKFSPSNGDDYDFVDFTGSSRESSINPNPQGSLFGLHNFFKSSSPLGATLETPVVLSGSGDGNLYLSNGSAYVELINFNTTSMEVVSGAGPIPEAATWLLMLSGVALSGAALRRRAAEVGRIA